MSEQQTRTQGVKPSRSPVSKLLIELEKKPAGLFASDRLAPKRDATPPAARQRSRPDAEIVGGEVSLASSSLTVFIARA